MEGGRRLCRRDPVARAHRELTNLETHQTVDPEVAVVVMTLAGQDDDTGGPRELSYIVVLTVHEGRIVRYRDYWNSLALEAAGR